MRGRACGERLRRGRRRRRERAGTVVWAIGDGGAGTDAAKRVAALIAKDDPKAVIFLGDVYEGGTAAEFETNFARSTATS